MTIETMAREFRYDGLRLPDPNAQLSVDESPNCVFGHVVWSENSIPLRACRFIIGRLILETIGPRDAEHSGSIPVRPNLIVGMDEPATTSRHRLPSGGEPGFTRAARWSTAAAQ